METKTASKYYRIFSHLIFWFAAYLFFVIFYGRANRDYFVTQIFASMLFPLSIATTYFINYYLIPRFLFTQKYSKFILFSFYTFVISIWLELLISLSVFVFFGNYQVYKMDPSSFDAVLLFVGLYFIILVATAIKLVRHSFQMQKRNRELDNLKLVTELKLKEAELKLLKAQIHPHFLFNTLNNLYGLTLEKSDDAPNLVLRLSEILDYILYRCNEKRVSLSEEINNLNNYIEIEKIRYSDKLKLEVNFPSNTNNLNIAPLILLPFVENAFKHGVSNFPGVAKVKSKISLTENNLIFNIENTKNPNIDKEKNYSKGIGLRNVKKRLDLMYPEKYFLVINDKTETFSVNLILQLD
ncbi:MAG: histidine kinase [Draconibacterium sp.]|nr:histidine kinase [Draconibacterium sp.]